MIFANRTLDTQEMSAKGSGWEIWELLKNNPGAEKILTSAVQSHYYYYYYYCKLLL